MDLDSTLAFFGQSGVFLFARVVWLKLKQVKQTVKLSGRDSAVSFSVLVYIDGTFCILYYSDRFWYIVKFGDFEKLSALRTLYSSAGCIFAE